jgi:hypothetical protein
MLKLLHTIDPRVVPQPQGGRGDEVEAEKGDGVEPSRPGQIGLGVDVPAARPAGVPLDQGGEAQEAGRERGKPLMHTVELEEMEQHQVQRGKSQAGGSHNSDDGRGAGTKGAHADVKANERLRHGGWERGQREATK